MSRSDNPPPRRPQSRRPSRRPSSLAAFRRQVRKKTARRLKARQKKEYSHWQGVGAFGLIGWSVMVPLVLGIALGLWLDTVWPVVPWTLVLMLVGLLAGCLNAWYWVQRESQGDD